MNDINIWHWTPGGMRLGPSASGEDDFIRKPQMEPLHPLDPDAPCIYDDLVPALLRRQAE